MGSILSRLEEVGKAQEGDCMKVREEEFWRKRDDGMQLEKMKEILNCVEKETMSSLHCCKFLVNRIILRSTVARKSLETNFLMLSIKGVWNFNLVPDHLRRKFRGLRKIEANSFPFMH